MSYQFWLIFPMENVKFKEKRRELKIFKSSQSTDKTIQQLQ